jgi:hypothetical protein
MRNLQEATERICELKGSLVAFDAMMSALVRHLSADERQQVMRNFSESAEVARTVLLHATISEVTVAAFERDVARMTVLLEPDTQA